MKSVSGSLIRLSPSLPEGLSETEVELDGEAQSLILCRDGTDLRAWLNLCPHAGRRLDWAPGRFLLDKGHLVCAAHGASFDLRDGRCVAGPCRGESLQAVPVQLDDADRKSGLTHTE